MKDGIRISINRPLKLIHFSFQHVDTYGSVSAVSRYLLSALSIGLRCFYFLYPIFFLLWFNWGIWCVLCVWLDMQWNFRSCEKLASLTSRKSAALLSKSTLFLEILQQVRKVCKNNFLLKYEKLACMTDY